MAEPFSYRVYPADGTVDIFSIPFPYLEKAHIHVFVGGVETSEFSWLTSNSVKLNSKPASGDFVKVQRITPKDARVVNFQNGTNFVEADLDTSADQTFFIVQEAFDSLTAQMQLDNTGRWDGLGKVLTNLGEAVGDTDAVTLKHYNTVMIPAMQAIQAATQTLKDGTASIKNQTQAIYDATVAIQTATDAIRAQAAAQATASANSASASAASASAAHNSEVAAAASAASAAGSQAAIQAIVDTGIPDATSSVKGKVQLATDSDALAGVNTAKAVTPANLKAVADTKVGLGLFTAAWDFVVGSAAGQAVKKTLAEVKAALNLGAAADKGVQASDITTFDDTTLPTSLAVKTYVAKAAGGGGGIRQCVLAGVTDISGRPAYLSIESHADKTVAVVNASETNPLIVSFADGSKDRVATITSPMSLDITSYKNAASAPQKKLYFYLTLDTNDNVSLGCTWMKPRYSSAAKSSLIQYGSAKRGFTSAFGSHPHASYPLSKIPEGSWMIFADGAPVGAWFAFNGFTQKVKTILCGFQSWCPSKLQWSSNSTNGSDGTWNDIGVVFPTDAMPYYYLLNGQNLTAFQVPDYGATGAHMLRILTTGTPAGQIYNLMFSTTTKHIAEDLSTVKGVGANWLNADTIIYSAQAGTGTNQGAAQNMFDERRDYYWNPGSAGAHWIGVKDIPNDRRAKCWRACLHNSYSYWPYLKFQWSGDNGSTWNDISSSVGWCATLAAELAGGYKPSQSYNPQNAGMWFDIPIPDYTPTSGDGKHQVRLLVCQSPTDSNHYAYTNQMYVYECEWLVSTDVYSIPNGVMSDHTGTPIKRVYIGEVQTYSGYWLYPTAYAICGRFETPWMAMQTYSTQYSFALGIHEDDDVDWEVLARLDGDKYVKLDHAPGIENTLSQTARRTGFLGSVWKGQLVLTFPYVGLFGYSFPVSTDSYVGTSWMDYGVHIQHQGSAAYSAPNGHSYQYSTIKVRAKRRW